MSETSAVGLTWGQEFLQVAHKGSPECLPRAELVGSRVGVCQCQVSRDSPETRRCSIFNANRKLCLFFFLPWCILLGLSVSFPRHCLSLKQVHFCHRMQMTVSAHLPEVWLTWRFCERSCVFAASAEAEVASECFQTRWPSVCSAGRALLRGSLREFLCHTWRDRAGAPWFHCKHVFSSVRTENSNVVILPFSQRDKGLYFIICPHHLGKPIVVECYWSQLADFLNVFVSKKGLL